MDEDDARDGAIDPVTIDRLDRLGGDDLVGKMAALFIELGPERMAAATEGLEAGDLHAIERAAHSLKSSAGNIGAAELAEVAGRLERLSEEERAESIPAALETMERALDRAIVALRPLASTGQEKDPS